MSWVAKNKLTGEIYSKKYSSVYDCQNYIDNHLDLDKLWEEYFYNNSITDKLDKLLYKLKYGNIVKCYNTKQNRFCDGFDF